MEVAALGGAPGVYSARYAGVDKSAEKNIGKLLSEMKKRERREAQLRTVIVLLIQNKKFFFEGIVNGKILTQLQGNGGFGYDPIFQPDGYTKSFGELPATLKNKISHRAKAFTKMLDYLHENLAMK